MNLLQRLFLIIGIIIIVGGSIKLFGLNNLDVCDDSDLVQNLTESPWILEDGRQSILFKEDGSFELLRPFNNDGVSLYVGNYKLKDDCHVLFSKAKFLSEYDGVNIRHVELKFMTEGELSSSIGIITEIDFTTNRYNTISLNGITYLKEWDFPQLTKSK